MSISSTRPPWLRGDTGSAIVAAVAVAFIALSLGVLIITVAISTAQDSGKDRQRTSQVHAAEAGVDQVYYDLQTGQTPCTLPRFEVGSAPDVTYVDARVDYYGPSNDLLTCAAGVLSGAPAKAVITADSASSNKVGPGSATRPRSMQSEVLLAPSSGGAGYAIYTYSEFSVPNSFDLSESGEDSPDIYARQGFTCSNSSTTSGSVFSALGSATLSNSCSIGGNLEVRGDITMSNKARVEADAFSSRGGLTLNNTASVGRDATVWGGFSGSTDKVGGTITTHNSTGPFLADPLDQPLPYVGFVAADWTSQGYQVVDVGTDCDVIKNGGGGVTSMFDATVPTVYYGNCKLDFSNNNSGLELQTDVALFLEQGISVKNNFELASSDTAVTRKLYVIDPAGIGPMPTGWDPATCTGADLDFGNKTDIDKSVNVFLYTCGTIEASNNSDLYGQFYGKSVTVANSFTMHFVSMPPVGVDLGGAPASPGFKVEVVYKRETQLAADATVG